ncbi:MAG: protein-L-isoaspartate(D-aspartate) O-methyltransferase [Thermodesulfobacteriota bacterium]
MLESFIPLSLFFVFLLASGASGNGRYAGKRWDMVESQIIARGIRNTAVIQAMLNVPRHEFVPEEMRDEAYNDNPIPVGMGQTISQPYIVALMTELLNPARGMKILEVGTGSGYQSAVLAETGCDLYTIEIVESLAQKARLVLEKIGYSNIAYKIGDGYQGWEEHAPFDGIIVTAAPGHVPAKLLDQLKVNGRMVIPVGGDSQELQLIEKTDTGITKKRITAVRFVPMTGRSES